MADTDYRRALDAAIAEYEALGEERQRIDRRLAELTQTISTLSRLLGLTPTMSLGLTDAIRLVMRAGEPMTPTEVRGRLDAVGFDLSRYANDLAAIHTILKRLNASGELRFIPRSGGHQYAWNRPPATIVLESGPEARTPGPGEGQETTGRVVDPVAAVARLARAVSRRWSK